MAVPCQGIALATTRRIGTGDAVTSYWDLPGFEDVYLEDSWVIDVRATMGRVAMSLDVVLRETHAAYRAPREGEQYCYRSGSIRFEAVSDLRWTGQAKQPAVDSDGELDLGAIDGFEAHDEVYQLSGDFGSIYVHSPQAPTLTLL